MKKIYLYQSRFPLIVSLFFAFLLLISVFLFVFIGFAAFLVAGLFAVFASALKRIFSKKSKNLGRYDPETKTYTLDESEYKIVDKD